MERMTQQRRVIRDVFERIGQPLSVQEAFEAARDELPGLGVATVYRAINDLSDNGWLVPVELPGESTRYERAGIGHHHHFQCRGCGRVYDFDGCPGDLKRLAPDGFQVDGHEIILYGRCADCVATG